MDEPIKGFDRIANSYDISFSDTETGRLQRKRVLRFMDRSFLLKEKRNIIEINCGTGIDACYFHQAGHDVIATDGSVEMIRQARLKNDDIDFRTTPFSAIHTLPELANAEMIFSNFGGLNCLSKDDLREFFQKTATEIRKDAYIVLVVMPRFCVTESMYFLLKGRWNEIFRRRTNKAVRVKLGGVNVPVWYHSPAAIKKIIQVDYKIEKQHPVGLFLPPSYLDPFFKKHRLLLKIAYFQEKIFSNISLFSSISDHFILIARKR